MNGYSERAPAPRATTPRATTPRASRETFLAHLHDYLVQNGCLQTANALEKEASFRVLGETQDSLFYDWWCQLLSMHNLAGTQQPQPPGLPAGNWIDGSLPTASIASTSEQMNEARPWPNQQAFKVPNHVKAGNAVNPTSPAVAPQQLQQASSMLRPHPKSKAKTRKSLPHNKLANKGLPILVPGVAPLVVARSTSNGPMVNAAAPRQVNIGQNAQIRGGQPQQPNTPQWDNEQLMAEAFQRKTPLQRPLPPLSSNQSLQTVGARAMALQNSMPLPHQPPQQPYKNQHSESIPGDPQQQVLHHQQTIQQQHLFNLLQQAHAQGGVVQNGALGSNGSMASVRSNGPMGAIGGPGTMADRGMQIKKENLSDESGGNHNTTNFLDYMMNDDHMAHVGVNFPAEDPLEGMGFDSAAPGNEFVGGNELFTPNLTRAQGFDEKRGDHAGMNPSSAISGDGFSNSGFGFDAQLVLLVGPDENASLNEGNFRMGSGLGFGGEGAHNDFFFETPLTMTL